MKKLLIGLLAIGSFSSFADGNICDVLIDSGSVLHDHKSAYENVYISTQSYGDISHNQDITTSYNNNSIVIKDTNWIGYTYEVSSYVYRLDIGSKSVVLSISQDQGPKTSQEQLLERSYLKVNRGESKTIEYKELSIEIRCR